MEKEQRKIYPEVMFVFTRHSPKDSACIWETVKGADILLLEQVGSSPEMRKIKERTINIIHLEPDPEKRENLAARLTKKGSLAQQLLIMASAEGKELKFIDVDSSWQGFFWRKAEEKLFKAALEASKQGKFSFAYEFFRSSIFNDAIYIFERDIFVSNQIKEILNANIDRWIGKKVASIQGTMHSKTFFLFSNDFPEIPIGKVFTSQEENFTLRHRAHNDIFLSSRAEAELSIKRLFIKEFAIYESVGGSSHFVSADARYEISDMAAQLLTEKEINKIFDELEMATTRIDNRFRGNDPRSKALRANHAYMELRRIGKNILQSKKNLFAAMSMKSLVNFP